MWGMVPAIIRWCSYLFPERLLLPAQKAHEGHWRWWWAIRLRWRRDWSGSGSGLGLPLLLLFHYHGLGASDTLLAAADGGVLRAQG